MEDVKRIHVEVAYATTEKQKIIGLDVPEGTTLIEAINTSGILDEFPEIDAGKAKMGIFSKPKKPDTALREGDRVEIYRPLIADPKEVRKQRAAQGKRMKKGGGDAEAEQKPSAENDAGQG
ncbi:MAG: RnfH family protein [Granulosicoccaceae bacterium]|jgi:putative ubiquitin-RnfH superfamily antitoxin RatB of RatAB toxin-antitoxin module